MKYIEYTAEYYDDLKDCIEELQDYKISIDPDKFSIRKPGYGKYKTDHLLASISQNGGQIILLLEDDKVCGCGAAIINTPVDEENVEFFPVQFGELKRLYIRDAYRGMGYGNVLIQKLEDYLTQSGCEYIALDVLNNNVGAYDKYKKAGYTDRYTRMLKKIK